MLTKSANLKFCQRISTILKQLLGFRTSLLLLVAWAVLSTPARAGKDPDWIEDDPGVEESQVESNNGKTILKLGVKHSEQLSPVPDSLQTGAVFDDKLLEVNDVHLKWYRIPKWLAGKWRRNRETTVFSYDYTSGISDRQSRTFMSEQVADFGVQKDNNGNIWNCDLASRGISDRGSYRSIAFVKLKEPVRATAQDVIFREVFTVVHVAKTSNMIVDSFCVESLTRHRPISDGNLETVMSVKIYNQNGRPRQVQENIAYERLIGPLSLVDQYKGKNVKEDFVRFLRENELGALVPH